MRPKRVTRAQEGNQIPESLERQYSALRLTKLIRFCLLVLLLGHSPPALTQVQPQVNSADASERLANKVLPTPSQQPKVRVLIRDWALQTSELLHIVSDKTTCSQAVADYFDLNSRYQPLNPANLRDEALNHLDTLLRQHQAAVSSIVSEAERLAAAHNFVKDLRVNYTDVHRLRNELEWVKQLQIWQQEQAANGSSGGNESLASLNANWGTSGGGGVGDRGGNQQPTSINGGAPVPGPPEWQTPIRSVVMQINSNFGDIPVNSSMSAVHLPLPIYPGLPEIMNTIAWTEGLDDVFKRNLANFAHVHHQYYGDQLGPLRTFPAHKWRIPRLDPDLFDARTRPWYSAGVATPKDVVILVDTSGSMTGLRREIAKGVVFEILDTLTNDNHFAVLRFSETVTPVGIPRCQLKRPKLAPDLHDFCLQQHRPSPQISPSVPATREECYAYQNQWDQQSQYLRDHPDLVPGINATYITDDAYFNSIGNVTSDIRDAYLLPATSRNIRYLKSNFSMPTAGIANFTHALMAAFELLNAYNRTQDQGSQCNKAIMLITDGAIRSHDEVFHRYNYPGSPVRVFTYMIGREVGDIKPTKAMACNNRGYYTNVINLSEIREQVLKYIPVFARPEILAHHHPTTWTNAYGDETYQVLTDWVLEMKRRERARIMLNEERERILAEANSSEVITDVEYTNIPEYDELLSVNEELKKRIICEDGEDDPEALDQSLQEEIDPLGYNELACHWSHSRKADLLTSVVQPVYDSKNSSIAFQRILHKQVWTEKEIHLRNARLLGVAAVDLRIMDMMQLTPSHQLGPNAYPILIGHGGFLLHHQDLRALLEDPFDKQSKILKPFFNAVDLTQVEQVHPRNESDPKLKNLETKLSRLRDAIIRRQTGETTLHLKRNIDCRRRPHIRTQQFYYAPIRNTPFSLVLAIPQDYGKNRVNGKLELREKNVANLQPIDRKQGEQWTLHPGYRYCEGGPLQALGNDSVAAINLLLRDTSLWKSVKLLDLSGFEKTEAKHGWSNSIVCDQELFPSLLFDAAATNELRLAKSCLGDSYGQENSREKLGQIHGLELSFIATRSGLTRVQLFESSHRTRKLAELFAKRHNRAIDEPWYARTVDFNSRYHEDSLLVSAPFNAYVRLVAKLRQRITQRHPAINDTRANCDIPLDFNESEGSGNSIETSSSQSPEILMNASTILSPPGTKDSPEQPQADDSNSSEQGEQVSRVDYNEYSTFEMLDLIANSSVHISVTQTIWANRKTVKERTPVAVSGVLYDYATFARQFLNATSIKIETDEESQSSDQGPKVQLCPDGECPTKCGYRNDSIDCLLVDSNSFIVVSEDLVNIGRSLAEYDDRLLASLIERRVFSPIRVSDYQAICSRNDQQAVDQQARSVALAVAAAASQSSADSPSTSLPGSSSWTLKLGSSLIANFANSIFLVGSALYSLLTLQTTDWQDWGQLMQLSRSVVDAQLTSSVNQSMLALLPNKTYLRPCERVVTTYETPRDELGRLSSEQPEYYATRCGCSAWYVYESVPKTNLMILIVNTTSSCRRNCSPDLGPTQLAPIPGSPLPGDQQALRDQMMANQANRTIESQVCAMLEQADQQASGARRFDYGSCITNHPEESQINICGGASKQVQLSSVFFLFTILLAGLIVFDLRIK